MSGKDAADAQRWRDSGEKLKRLNKFFDVCIDVAFVFIAIVLLCAAAAASNVATMLMLFFMAIVGFIGIDHGIIALPEGKK